VFLVRQNLFSLHVQVLSLISVALHLGYLVRWCINPVTDYSIAGASLTFLSSIGVAFLLFVEHKRLLRPSSFISLYLLCRVIADSVQLRTIVLRGYDNAVTGVLSAEISIQFLFLVLESWPEQRSIDDAVRVILNGQWNVLFHFAARSKRQKLRVSRPSKHMTLTQPRGTENPSKFSL
jgi:hypothetical protein